jgi:hypothetical protein
MKRFSIVCKASPKLFVLLPRFASGDRVLNPLRPKKVYQNQGMSHFARVARIDKPATQMIYEIVAK